MFRSGVPAVKQASDGFSMFDGAQQAEYGLEFGNQTFGSVRKEQHTCFLDQEEGECLEENPFMEKERCDEPSNTTVCSGGSDRSIILRNSNLWGGNTSQVNLGQLRAKNNLMTKMSRRGVSISKTFPAVWVIWMTAYLKATDQGLALFTISDHQRGGETIYSRVAVVLMAKDSWRGLGKHLV